MSRRNQMICRTITTAFLLALTLTLGLSCSADSQPARIVLIVIDTLRADALAKAPTPTLDNLVQRGQAFPNALASYHQTPLSIGALFTGRTPSVEIQGEGTPQQLWQFAWCGLLRLRDPAQERRRCIPEGIDTLATALRDAGYTTIGVVSNGLIFEPFGLARGFDAWVEVGDSSIMVGKATAATQQSISRSHEGRAVNQAVFDVLAQRDGDRFFLYIHYMDVHDYNFARRKPGGFPYLASIRRVDRVIGELLDHLESLGLVKDSLIVVTSDHGQRLYEKHVVAGTRGHRGNPSFEELLHIPLIVAPPISKDSSQLIRGEDIPSMILGATGRRFETHKDLRADELFVSEVGWQTYRKGRWKSFQKRGGELVLVDLHADPGEKTDVAAENPRIARSHRERISEIARSLAAPREITNPPDPTYEGRLRALGYIE